MNNKGSILIMVLWTLVMISYLVGIYLVHNRSKTGTALNFDRTFRQRNAIESLVHLTSTDEWKAALDEYTSEKWVDMEVAGVSLRFRLDDESQRINVNTAGDGQIQQAMVDIFGETDIEKAHGLTDKILDWRDTNDLIRVNGAEKRQYAAAGLGYLPADGPFKTLTEMLMVMGMTHRVFWGNPGVKIEEISEEENIEENDYNDKSVFEAFTVFESGTRRLSVLTPLAKDGPRLYTVLFIKGKNSLDVIETYTAFLEG